MLPNVQSPVRKILPHLPFSPCKQTSFERVYYHMGLNRYPANVPDLFFIKNTGP